MKKLRRLSVGRISKDLTAHEYKVEKGTAMDYINESSYTGVPFTELPLGFGMALAQSEPAMKGYAALTETEKEQLILRCKDVKTKEEMQKIVDSLVPGEDVRAIYQEEKESFS